MVLLIILTVVFAVWSCHANYEWCEVIAMIFAMIAGIASTICLIVFCSFIWNWQASEYQAKIINREYDSDYTQAEVFYASNVIDIIQKLERGRMELIISNKEKGE